ncbi:MAG: ATP-binding protein, partial [Chitinophagales bacterium]
PKSKEACDNWDDITFLNKAKVTIQGKITNTALLLLGKEEATHLLQPATAKISWILKDVNNIELDYEHFGPPFILNTTALFNKIRNLTYRYIADASLFPVEIKTYEPYVIREALHNCIAHQDYGLHGRITVIEKPEELVFTNLGKFLPGNIKTVIEQDAPQAVYRNAFLSDAMVNLNMIDTIGSGIKRMFLEQRNRFFPMPDYDLSDTQKVEVRISGKIWDENYTRLLMNNTDLDLKTVILLDSVQKSIPIDKTEIKVLRRAHLIEGRKPNLYVAASIAKATGGKTDYIKNRGFDNEYYRDFIIKYIKKFNTASRQDIEELLMDKLPEVLSEQQKKDKVKNMLQYLKNKEVIELNEDKEWKLKD